MNPIVEFCGIGLLIIIAVSVTLVLGVMVISGRYE